jgi:hypothetical protein
VLGAGLRSAGHRMDVENTASVSRTQDLQYSTFGLVGNIAYAYAWTPWLHSEFGPFVSVGGAEAEWFDQDATLAYRKATAEGSYGQAGLRLGTYACIVRHLVLGLEIEHSATYARMKAEHSASSGESNLTIRTHGFGGGLALGYRF